MRCLASSPKAIVTRALRFSLYCLGAVVCIVSYESCAKNHDAPFFDGDKAYEYLKEQVNFGPRVPGSENAVKCREYFLSFFHSLGVKVDTMAFTHDDKASDKQIPMANIIAHFRGVDSAVAKNYLFAAHWDSRPRAEYDPDSTKRNSPIDGANDGASGVAILMELGNLLAKEKPRVNIDIALLDGEDWGAPGDIGEYFLGAKDLVKRDITGKYKFAVLVDMVGDKDLKICREEFSNHYFPQLNDVLWNTAGRLGEKSFVDSVGYSVMDDHLSFMTIGIPSAVIIDFDYKYWHTTQDTPDKCSAQSLLTVGRVLTEVIYQL